MIAPVPCVRKIRDGFLKRGNQVLRLRKSLQAPSCSPLAPSLLFYAPLAAPSYSPFAPSYSLVTPSYSLLAPSYFLLLPVYSLLLPAYILVIPLLLLYTPLLLPRCFPILPCCSLVNSLCSLTTPSKAALLPLSVPERQSRILSSG